jgi:hypothetical protein
MFTDGPVTPARVETLLDLLRQLNNRKFDREKIFRLLQPEALPGVTTDTKRDQAAATLKAAFELGLVTADDHGRIRTVFDGNDPRTTQRIVLDALDEHVLGGSMEPEPFFALFYSYSLALGKEGVLKKSAADWAIEFDRDVFAGQRQNNPFNTTKYTGLRRWFRYAGLGWHDTEDVFQPNPFERVLRRLPVIFDGLKKVRGEEFMDRLGQACAELDGGSVFRRAAAHWNPENKTCTLGLSHALVELHQEKKIRLYCPQDSRGWSIEKASPPSDDTLKSDKIEIVELLNA